MSDNEDCVHSKMTEKGPDDRLEYHCDKCGFVAIISDGRSPKPTSGVMASPARPTPPRYGQIKPSSLASHRKLEFKST
jgi:hypothetical protein